MTVEQLQGLIDMNELRRFNPKLHAQIESNPEILLDLQQIVADHEIHAEAAAVAESITAATEVASQAALKPIKTYSLPFIWAWGAPVFNATAATLISL